MELMMFRSCVFEAVCKGMAVAAVRRYGLFGSLRGACADLVVLPTSETLSFSSSSGRNRGSSAASTAVPASWLDPFDIKPVPEGLRLDPTRRQYVRFAASTLLAAARTLILSGTPIDARLADVLTSLLVVRDADTVAYGTVAIWVLAADARNREVLGRSGAVHVLAQWSCFLLRQAVDEVCNADARIWARLVKSNRALLLNS